MDNMNYRDKYYWFPARKSGGWGWGIANSWQGALIQLGYPVLSYLDFFFFRRQAGIALFLFLLLTVAFFVIHWVKGEPPTWRW
jgi:hypothetical protein